MPPVNPELVAKAASSADKAKKGADAAKKAGSSGSGKGNGNLPEINRRSGVTNAQNFLRSSEDSAENGEEVDSSSENSVNYTGSGRSRAQDSGGRFSFKGEGKGKLNVKNVKNLKKAAPLILILGVMLLPVLLIFGTGSLLFADIDENTMEQMDIQYVIMRKAAMLGSKIALENGSIPSPFVEELASAGLEVGYLDDSGTFIAGLRPVSDSKVASTTTSESLPQDNLAYVSNPEEDNSLVIRFKDRIITASEWLADLENIPELYAAFDEATYGRAAGHYDDVAETFYSNINASRNIFANYSGSDTDDFRKVLGNYYTNKADSAYVVEDKDCKDGTGKCDSSKNGNSSAVETYLDTLYENTLIEPDNCDWKPGSLICKLAGKTPFYDNSIHGVYDKAQAAALAYLVNSAVNANETYESMKYFLTLEEVMGKTKAGDGSSAPINEMLNYLTTADESGISAVQSPTLSSVLTKSFGGYNSENETAPFSLDRIQAITEKYMTEIKQPYLRTALAITGISWNNSSSSSYGVKDNSLSMIKLLEDDPPTCDENDDSDPTEQKKCQEEWEKYQERKDKDKRHPVTARLIEELTKALSGSDESKTTFLSDDGFNTVVGTHSGELFSKGGSILGSKIATFGQGGTSSTEASVVAYKKETDHILALDAAADRVNKSPFDITSQNTFLGNIVHSFSNYLYTTPSLASGFSSFSSVLRNSFTSLLPGAFADSDASFQTTYGDCPENDLYGNGFVCSTFSYPTVSFDTDHIMSYIENNPTPPTNAEDFIKYNNNRTSNPGYINTTFADEIGCNNVVRQFSQFIKNKVTQFGSEENRLADYFSTYYSRCSDDDLKKISGTAFTDGGAYKDAQAYSVLSRFLDQIGYYSEENTNPTAFSESFDRPGTGESPYIALLKETSTDFSTLNDAEYLAAISGMSEEEANVVLGYFAYESYLASIDYENRLAFGREETFDFENSIQFEETDPFEAELAVIAKNDHLKITRKDPSYVA